MRLHDTPPHVLVAGHFWIMGWIRDEIAALHTPGKHDWIHKGRISGSDREPGCCPLHDEAEGAPVRAVGPSYECDLAFRTIIVGDISRISCAQEKGRPRARARSGRWDIQSRISALSVFPEAVLQGPGTCSGDKTPSAVEIPAGPPIIAGIGDEVVAHESPREDDGLRDGRVEPVDERRFAPRAVVVGNVGGHTGLERHLSQPNVLSMTGRASLDGGRGHGVISVDVAIPSFAAREEESALRGNASWTDEPFPVILIISRPADLPRGGPG